ncbi:hypothetical protein [Barrientosiimonas endolithica]|uniref:Uncharacterized protein n=1 Tax=Barrientosiimonas endolithica TaxID=1535208 RepID=A0ABM8HAB3_9MICO|nr:hypothetical protein [Barrientosiimonas endolithica]BDZ57872.1 hypothetical protein GCM10025872_15290 [Barrientosiimonas endolithica]
MSTVEHSEAVETEPQRKGRKRVLHWYWEADSLRALAAGATTVRSVCGLVRLRITSEYVSSDPLRPVSRPNDCKRCQAVLDARDRRWVNSQLKELEKQFR